MVIFVMKWEGSFKCLNRKLTNKRRFHNFYLIHYFFLRTIFFFFFFFEYLLKFSCTYDLNPVSRSATPSHFQPLHTAAAPARHRRCTLRCGNFILPTSSPPLPPSRALSSFRAIRVTSLCISLRNTVVQPLHAVVEIAPPPLIV